MTRTLLVYANCQGDEIAEMVARSECLGAEVAVERIFLGYLQDYLDRHGPDAAAARLHRVSMVWEQASDAGTEERQRLKALLPERTRWLRFPAFTCSAMWPFGVSDPRPGAGELFPYSDTLAARIWREQGGTHGFLATGDDDTLFERYLELSRALMPDPARVLERDLLQWRRRDADSDIRMADYLLENLRRERLFYTAGRPSWRPMQHLLERLLGEFLHDHPARDDALAEVAGFGSSYVGNDVLSTPIHPNVAEGLGLDWHDPQRLYRWKGSRWDFREWTIRCIRLSPHCD